VYIYRPEPWIKVKRCDLRARLLADAHYSRQTPGAAEFMPPGRTFVLLSVDEHAVWGVVENWFRGRRRWRVTIFRNVGRRLSSHLIRKATRLTRDYWRRRYGTPCDLTTEVDGDAVRPKRDPGRCFRRAGWIEIGRTKKGRHAGAVVFRAP
jgi:hypothetical protein